MRYVHSERQGEPDRVTERGKAIARGTKALDSAVAVAFHAVTCFRPEFSASETLVFLGVAHVTDHTIASTRPFNGAVSTDVENWTGLSRSTVQRGLQVLCEAGWLRALEGKGVRRYALSRHLSPDRSLT